MTALAATFALVLAASPVELSPQSAILTNGLSGGDMAVWQPVDGCEGYAPAEPQHRLAVPAGHPFDLTLSAPRGVLLIVRSPSGRVTCEVITCQQRACFGPIRLESAEAGLFEVWVGSRTREVRHPYFLLAVERGYQRYGQELTDVYARDVSKHGAKENGSAFADEFANWENTFLPSPALNLDFARLPRPIRLAGTVEVDPASKSSSTCPGSFAHGTAWAFRSLSQLDGLRMVVRGPNRPTLAVWTPDGRWLCSRELAGSTVLDVAPAAPGTYSVFVGGPPGTQPYSLSVVDETCDAAWTKADPYCRVDPNVGGSALTVGLPAATSVRILIDRGNLPNVDTRGPLEMRVAHGEDTSVRARPTRLDGIVRLRDGGRFICTASVIEWRGAPALLTAAHCLYESRMGRLGPRRARLRVDGLPLLALEEAIVPSSFEACVADRRSEQECWDGGATDLALIPFGAGEVKLLSLQPCRAPPSDRAELAVFGYGLDRGRLPSSLLMGAFLERGARLGMTVLSAIDGVQEVALGDSGGPVIAAPSLQADSMEVCYITSAVEVDSELPIGGAEHRALVQPAWDLEERLH